MRMRPISLALVNIPTSQTASQRKSAPIRNRHEGAFRDPQEPRLGRWWGRPKRVVFE